MRARHGEVTCAMDAMDEEEPDGPAAAAAAGWKHRIITVSKHIEREVRAHLPNPSDSD